MKKNRFRRVFFFVFVQFARIIFYKYVSDIKIKAKLRQPLVVNGCGDVDIDESVEFGVAYSPHFYTGYSYIEPRTTSSKVYIGKNTKINNNFCVISNGSGISIGSDCLIGINVQIIDSDFHSLDSKNRGNNESMSEAVIIGDSVFVGNDVRILKGVSIGSGSVIAASSVVVSNVPESVVVAGNPAKVVKKV